MEDPNVPKHEEDTTTPNTPASNDNRKLYIGFGVILLLLLLVGGWWISTQNNELDAAGLRIVSIEEAKSKSDSLYNQMKSELALYKQENEDLYSKLSDKEDELEQLYNKIKRLINQAERDQSKNREISKKLEKLTKELNNMRQYVDKQTKDIQELRKENIRLKKEKENLEEQVEASTEENEALKENTENLSKANEQLAEKVDEASVLRVTNIQPKSYRVRNNGKYREVKFAKRTEILKSCFSIVPNKVVEPGVNRFYLRIIDPAGFTMQDRARGSGRLTNDANKRVDYTVSKTFDYDPGTGSLCIEWSSYPTTPFSKGKYTVELYNKGRMVGRSKFELK